MQEKKFTARSRNDQIAVDAIISTGRNQVKSEVRNVFDLLISLSDQYKNDLLLVIRIYRLRTSSFGLWFGAYPKPDG
jgi:argininosuccinate lyase